MHGCIQFLSNEISEHLETREHLSRSVIDVKDLDKPLEREDEDEEASTICFQLSSWPNLRGNSGV